MSAVAEARSATEPPSVRGPLAPLRMDVKPVAPDTSVAEVGQRMLEPECDALLSLPVVDRHGHPVGCIGRYELMRVFLMPYGREVYGKRPISALMNRSPLVLPVALSIAEAARCIAEGIRNPITEDFILVDGDDRYIGSGVVLDVLRATESQLQQAFARLKGSQAQLIQSEKMASLGQMVAGLAHEINTPLGYVRNNLELLKEAQAGMGPLLAAHERLAEAMLAGADETTFGAAATALDAARAAADSDLMAELPELLGDTLHGVQQVGELVANLKDFSRLDQARGERVELQSLVESALKIAGHVLRKREVEVQRDFADVPAVECVPQQINQVLLNLLTNAAQAIDHGHGRIVVRTRVLSGQAAIVVEDNGKGIAAEHVKRIFDPFFTTKPVGQGTGLGLSICFQIVQQHGGSIRVASKPGVGTRFLVALPLHRKEAFA